MIRVGVVGAAGKMGRAVLAAVAAAPDLELAAAIDPRADELELLAAGPHGDHAGRTPGRRRWTCSSTSRARAAAKANLAPALRRGFHLVVGTTGARAEELAELAASLRRRGRERGGGRQLRHRRRAAHALRRLGRPVLRGGRDRRAAPRPEGRRALGDLDRHGDEPSPTPVVRRAMDSPHDPTTTVLLDGARGARADGAIPIHSVRLPGPGGPRGGALRVARARASRSATTATTGSRSCRACSWRCGRWRAGRG